MASLRLELVVLLSLLVILGQVHCMVLGDGPELEAKDRALEGAAKRDGGRRITRGRYRMGYMFGKRSGLEDNVASLLVKTLTSKTMSVQALGTALHKDQALARRVAHYMDKNGDGYVAVTELL